MVRLATFMARFPSPIDFQRLAGPDGPYWELVLDLPAAARIEYRLEITRSAGISVELDALNPDVATNPFGRNSVATGPGYVPPWWRGAGSPRGEMREIRVTSRIFGNRRHHHVYSPAGVRPRTPLPLLVVHDGSDYFDHGRLGDCLDAMIDRGSIPPVRALLFDPVERHREYVADSEHAGHLVQEVLPHFRRRFAVQGRPMVMGASLGAVASWHAVSSNPDIFSSVFLQSGTFAFEASPFLEDQMIESIGTFLRDVSERPRLRNRNVMITCGRYESLTEWNRKVVDLLSPVANVQYVESWAGHDWGAWADQFDPGLRHLFFRP